MNKSAFALAVLSAMTGAASAQSSVILFGVADLAARYVKNGGAGTQKQLSAGGLNTGRFGFRGVEDLGGGLFAGFHLESTVGPDVGAAGAAATGKFFDRRSTVSLTNPMGELRLGRDYNPTFWNTAIFDPFGAVGVGTVLNFTAGATLGSGATTTLRNDNSIGYFLPTNLGGVYGQAMVAAGEGTPGNKYVGGRLGYAAGPFDAAISYGRTETAFASDFDQSNIGASYKFGSVKAMGLYHLVKFGVIKQRTMLIGAVTTFGQSEIRASYIVNDRSGGATGSGFANGDDSRLMALGYVLNLSKRTALYGTASRITNDGAARAVVGGFPNNPALTGMLGGQTSSGFEMGVSHRF